MSKNKHYFLSALFFSALAVGTISCKKKKDSDAVNAAEVAIVNEDGSKSSYVLAVTADGSSAEATDYVVQTNDLMSGTISLVGKGIEQKSYRMYQQVGKTLLSITYQGTNIVPGYTLNSDGILQKKAKEFSILRLHARTNLNDNSMLGMYIPRDGSAEATLYEINATNMEVPREVKLNVFTASANNGKEQAYFSCLHVKGDKLFAPFFTIKNSSFETSFTDSAYITVYSYPGLEFQKVIKDPRTGTIGIYAGNDGIFEVENGDMYTYSTTAQASGIAPSAKPSGILRIKNGTTEFDPSYFFNIEEVTGGYKLAQIKYIGNSKALAQIYSFKDHVPADKWTTRDVRLAIVDLAAKTVNYVSDVPLHTGGMHNKFILEGNTAYLPINVPTQGIYIYKIDLANAKGTKGAQVQGKAVMGMFKLSN